MERILVTSALPYVNNVPHLGNIIGSTLSADVYTRYLRTFTDKKVLFLCGTDEYGTTTEIKAKLENITFQELCDKFHAVHKNVYDWFDIEFDIFGRTTTETQTQVTHEIFYKLLENGYIDKKIIQQTFCQHCDMFLADRYLQGFCYHPECVDKNNITNGDQCDYCGNFIHHEHLQIKWCSVCKSKNILLKESEHLFLRLDQLQELVEKYFLDPLSTVSLTDNAHAITKAWLSKKLEPRCITRDLKWGTPVPSEIIQNKVFYVWFDAPIGYLSILKHNLPSAKVVEEWMNAKMVQFMAKDNVPFHTVVFPATLLGSGLNYPIVSAISSTEYLDYQGQKFSKSKGVGVFGDQVQEISKRLGISSDYWRYYLIKIRPETKDSSFNWNEFITVINADLVNKIGNLVNRIINLTNKHKIITFDNIPDNEITLKINELIIEYKIAFDKFNFRDALNCVCRMAELGNLYLQDNQPWKLNDKELILKIFLNTIHISYNMIKLMYPIIPAISDKIMETIQCNNGVYQLNYDNYKPPFKKIDKNEVMAILSEMKLL